MKNKIEKNIRDLSLEFIQEVLLQEMNEKKFRSKQIFEWLWKKGVLSFDEMRNIPKNLREKLKTYFILDSLAIKTIQKSIDGTRKIAFALEDGNLLESVLIPSASRVTGCISTQVGCALGCKFCATGKLKFKRNLTIGEIFLQVSELNKIASEAYKRTLSNIVVMGMGEPLLNYENTRKALSHITSAHGLGMSPSRITLSTAGIAKNIKKLADDDIKFNLAISLHSAMENKRTALMPINKSNSLDELAKAIRYFHQKTSKRITYEYLMLNGINDSLEDARALTEFCKISPCKINLIEYNDTEESEFKKSTEKRTKDFYNYIDGRNIVVKIRHSKGADIDGACGQLANKAIGLNKNKK